MINSGKPIAMGSLYWSHSTIASRPALSVEGYQIHCRRLRAELPQHRRHLPAMVRPMVDEVLQQLPERLSLRDAPA